MDELPEDVDGIFEYLRVRIEGYGYLKWNEIAMMKADMMNVRRRWTLVDREAFRQKCIAVGMTRKETDEMCSYLRRTQEGRRLVPESTYRDFRFEPDPVPQPMRRSPGLVRPDDDAPPTTSRKWL